MAGMNGMMGMGNPAFQGMGFQQPVFMPVPMNTGNQKKRVEYVYEDEEPPRRRRREPLQPVVQPIIIAPPAPQPAQYVPQTVQQYVQPQFTAQPFVQPVVLQKPIVQQPVPVALAENPAQTDNASPSDYSSQYRYDGIYDKTYYKG